MLLSVILSFKNEEAGLPELFRRLDTVMKGLDDGDDYEYVFVNDASTDRSLDILMERARADRRVKIVNTSRSFGHDECFFAGYRYSKGDAVVLLAADLQDPPETILKMWRELKNGAEVVYTTRLSRPGESSIKMFLTKMAYRALHRITRVIVPDSGDFRMISRKVVAEILKVEERNPFARGLTFWVGFKHKQVFYHREKRASGAGHFPVLGGAPPKAFLNAVVSYSRWPLYFMLKVGLAFIIGSVLLGLGLALAGAAGNGIRAWMPLSCFFGFVSGLHFMFLGFVGLYASSAYDEARKRPNYIVASTHGID